MTLWEIMIFDDIGYQRKRGAFRRRTLHPNRIVRRII